MAGAGVRGDRYDERFSALAAAGVPVHGEADLVASLAPTTVLDAGCGTGRVAIELARRGLRVVGMDIDPAMLSSARAKAPELRWVEADLADPILDLGERFDLVVAAGNVMIFLTPGTEATALATMARHLEPEGRVLTGFQLHAGGLTIDAHDANAAAAGLVLEARWATWDRAPFREGGDYAVSLHRSAKPG
ncbi:MAG: class I SAM-dependent methyltransferase [Acidimicrobiales bacterium]